MPRIRMCDSDREKYKGPEWVEVLIADVLDEETGLIEQIEEAYDLTWPEFYTKLRRGHTSATRALIWIARRRAGCRDDPRTFRPRVQPHSGLRIEMTQAERELMVRAGLDPDGPLPEDDAVPPVPNRADRRAKERKRRAGSKPSSAITGSTSPAS